jgi:secondary thiamine-phosphate synthase enzyme
MRRVCQTIGTAYNGGEENMVITHTLSLRTRGEYDVQDITDAVARAVKASKLQNGIVTIFCPGSTGGITTIEFEDGVIHDLRVVLDEITPPHRAYRHHLRWHDDNGHSHIRAALIGPSLTVPFVNGELTLGTWQQIVFCDFDTSPRTRNLVIQIIGESSNHPIT